jgi:uncharacterized protein YgbK (DUF1537 family)
MFGLGKGRSNFGRFVDKYGISHGELVKRSGVSKDTVTKACSDDNCVLREISKCALVTAVNNLTGQSKSVNDFWK